MIIGDKFAWAHIGKTGGDATAIYFACFKDELNLTIDPSHQSAKHARFHERNITNDRILLLNIRRLPTFILSNIHHFGLQNNVNYIDDVLYRDYYLPNGLLLKHGGDLYITGYTNELALRVDRWFRCEYLADDVAEFLADYVGKSKDELVKILVGLHTKAFQDYNHDIYKYWKPEHIDKMYENNPLWAEVEKKVYGSLAHSASG